MHFCGALLSHMCNWAGIHRHARRQCVMHKNSLKPHATEVSFSHDLVLQFCLEGSKCWAPDPICDPTGGNTIRHTLVRPVTLSSSGNCSSHCTRSGVCSDDFSRYSTSPTKASPFIHSAHDHRPHGVSALHRPSRNEMKSLLHGTWHGRQPDCPGWRPGSRLLWLNTMESRMGSGKWKT